ncbi:TetR/AcrR family transcriptional regulator [Solirubrobacter soli]|uniref:TetR/AcrR family transcriptional regulator n=1 Tax=Solirubrobacter soli TaxID=363832 RepID=UPI001B7FCB77|nr:TetR family transcriptional regulator [Solirubrobacter soli]
MNDSYMARSSRKDTEKHRQQVIDGAATLLRERGVDGVNVGALMAEAGLTHGGFYRHFASKDELVRLALEKAMADQTDWLAAQSEQGLIDFYLSPEHRDDPGHGCTIGALGSEVGRAGEDERAAFAEGVRRYIDTFASLSGVEREEALARYSTMVGALVISRATAGDPISEEVLGAARSALAHGE